MEYMERIRRNSFPFLRVAYHGMISWSFMRNFLVELTKYLLVVHALELVLADHHEIEWSCYWWASISDTWCYCWTSLKVIWCYYYRCGLVVWTTTMDELTLDWSPSDTIVNPNFYINTKIILLSLEVWRNDILLQTRREK